MAAVSYRWSADGEEHCLEFVKVAGTNGEPYLFEKRGDRRPIEIGDFYIATTPLTQALWLHVMGSNPAEHPGMRLPVENVSWNHINEAGGFLDRINSSEIRTTINEPAAQAQMHFRLPSETEWEYAARGGPHWGDDLIYSGSNDPQEVAWYGPHWGYGHNLIVRLFGWRRAWRLANRFNGRRQLTHTHEVALKAPNQLGIFDMSGNVWEWCQDVCTDDLSRVPENGRAYVGEGQDRRLRGGCHHNWNLHCTVSWQYGIDPAAHGGCIGFRLALA